MCTDCKARTELVLLRDVDDEADPPTRRGLDLTLRGEIASQHVVGDGGGVVHVAVHRGLAPRSGGAL